MRFIARFALVVALCLSSWGRVSAKDASEAYDAHLPNPEWTESDPPIDYHATRVVDDQTGKPIQGATMAGYVEDVDPRTIGYAKQVCEATANADGIAWAKSPGEERAEHWLIRADGYAPSHAFAFQPPTVVRLRRGVQVSGRLADVLGEPLAGARVDLYCGCEHGPVFGSVTADAKGFVQLPAVDIEHTRLWCVPPRGHVRAFGVEALARATARGQPLIFDPARTLRGRVVDAKGKPVSDAVVRAFGWQPPVTDEDWGSFPRGPATRTDAKGSFRLPGLDRGEGVIFVSPDGAQHTFRRVPPTLEPRLELVLDGSPLDESEERTGAVELRAIAPKGGALPLLPPWQAVRADGLVRDKLALTPGKPIEFQPGSWTVLPASEFLAATFDAFEIEVAPGATVEHDVVVVQQPRTAFAGVARPVRDAEFIVATATQKRPASVALIMAGLAFLPSDRTASLFNEDGLVRFEPTADACRSVRVEAVPESLIELKTPFEVESISVRQGGVELEWPDADMEDLVHTTYRGDLLLLVEDDTSRIWRAPVTIPGPGSRVTVDLAKIEAPPVRGMVALTLQAPDGKPPEDVTLVATHPNGTAMSETTGGTLSEDELDGPCHVRITARGLQPLEADLKPGKRTLKWGPQSLVLEVAGPDGKRVQSVVMVDGELHRDFGEEPFRLGGLSKGKHRVVVTPLDLTWRGVQMELDLEQAETLQKIQFKAR